MSIESELRKIAEHNGIEAFGICSSLPFDDSRRQIEENKAAGLNGAMQFVYRQPQSSCDPSLSMANVQTLVVIASRYAPKHVPASTGESEWLSNRASIARYARSDSYAPLREVLEKLANYLIQSGFEAQTLSDSNQLVDRAAAVRAGLGWFGKNSNVLLYGLGSYFVLGAVLTSAPLEVSSVNRKSTLKPGIGCGGCNSCIDACPTGAIVEPGVIDARRCLAWLVQDHNEFPVEFREALGGRIYGCDSCQDVCPVNLLPSTHRTIEIVNIESTTSPKLSELLSLDDQSLVDKFQHWYIPKRRGSFIRRNILIALGNVGPVDDSKLDELILAQSKHSSSQVREAAHWCIQRLEQRRSRQES